MDRNRDQVANRTHTQDKTTKSDSTDYGMMTAMFSDRDSAEKAYNELVDRGYTQDEINLVMTKETHDKYFSHDEDTEIGNKAAEGTGAGSAIGGTLGAIGGAIAAVGTSIAIPGLGLVIAGPVAAGLAGAGAGGLAGGIIGALIGWGIPEERAKEYESGIKDGHIVIGFHPRNEEDAEIIERKWRNYDAREIYS